VEGCKHELEISIPADAVEAETEKVTKNFQGRAKLPGFRPGKVPASLVRRTFAGDIRQKVLENLVPRFFDEKAKEENLRVVGTSRYIPSSRSPNTQALRSPTHSPR
jgi:trigger factor